jgi:hypothetical protein
MLGNGIIGCYNSESVLGEEADFDQSTIDLSPPL